MSPPPPLHQPIFRKYPSFSIYRRINEFHENTVKVKIILNKTGSVSDLLFQNFDSSTDFTVTPRYTRYDFFFCYFSQSLFARSLPSPPLDGTSGCG